MGTAELSCRLTTVSLRWADNDCSQGFVEGGGDAGRGNNAVHFKGTNFLRLHGDMWAVQHGASYVLEETPVDFTNNVKEVRLHKLRHWQPHGIGLSS